MFYLVYALLQLVLLGAHLLGRQLLLRQLLGQVPVEELLPKVELGEHYNSVCYEFFLGVAERQDLLGERLLADFEELLIYKECILGQNGCSEGVAPLAHGLLRYSELLLDEFDLSEGVSDLSDERGGPVNVL